MPLIQLEQTQSYIHWFILNEKDFGVTGGDKSALWALPKIPTPDCSGKLKEVSSSVWAAARWGLLYYISIYFPQHLSNFSQARLMACSVSDNLKLGAGPLYGIRRDYEFYLPRKWTFVQIPWVSFYCVLSFELWLWPNSVVSVHTSQGQLEKDNYWAMGGYYLNMEYFNIWICLLLFIFKYYFFTTLFISCDFHLFYFSTTIIPFLAHPFPTYTPTVFSHCFSNHIPYSFSMHHSDRQENMKNVETPVVTFHK